MARYLGIDIASSSIKVALVRGAGRNWAIEDLRLIELPAAEQREASAGAALGDEVHAALVEAASKLASAGDPLAVGFPGEQIFVRMFEVPAAVRRRMLEVLPFELESQLPFDIQEAVWDYRFRPNVPAIKPLPVMIAAARTEQVRARIEQVQKAVQREPDHVVPGAFPLLDLLAALNLPKTEGTRAILDLGASSGELLLVDHLEPLFARTISRGVRGLPDSGKALVGELRRSLAAIAALGLPEPKQLLLTGGAALIAELPRWLSRELGIVVEALPLRSLEVPKDKQADLHRFSRAIGIALNGTLRHQGLDLRRGPLAYERGYGFLWERWPLLAGLAAAIVLSFAFSSWAQASNLAADRKVLEEALKSITQEVYGEGTSDLDRVNELLAQRSANADDDPLPRADGMDVLVQLSELIPARQIKHDVEKLEMSKQVGGGFRIELSGIAPSGADVSAIETALKGYRCFNNPMVTKKVKAIVDDRQKYTLETELRCPEEGGGQKKNGTPSPAGSKTP